MIELIKPEVTNFAKYCLLRGATITDLVIPTTDQKWPGLCNPSIFNDNGQLRLVLRNVNYVMHASYFSNHNWAEWGMLQYIIPGADWEGRYLKTRNYLCDITDDGEISQYKLVNTSKFDKKPKWEFVGHEDARLVRWDSKLYMTGVRRDDNTTGVGRMSLCCVDEKANEVSRKKIDGPDAGYCEKNWMAITDMPYHYVRLSYPKTEIVKVDPRTGSYETVISVDQPENPAVFHDMMIRGSSQVIPWKDGKHIALTHTCNLILDENGKKYSRYHFHFIVWDANWKIEAISKLFTFNDFNIEFSNGLAMKNGYFYIPFALQDNMSFLMKVPESVVDGFIYDNPEDAWCTPVRSLVHDFFMDDKNVGALSALAHHYYEHKFKAGAYDLFQRAVDFTNYGDDLYENTFWMARSVADLGDRDPHEFEMWWRLIDLDPNRPEGWMALHMFYRYRDAFNDSYHTALMAYRCKDNAKLYYDPAMYEIELYCSMMFTEHREEAIEYGKHHTDNTALIESLQYIIDNQKETRRIL